MPLDPAPTELQRARGRAEIAVSLRRGAIRLDRLYQEGCAKAILPRTHGPVPEVVLINTAGGVTGGDRIDWRLAVGPGAALVATTQAAERVYRSTGGPAQVTTRLELGAGARLDWLPQETILFEAGRLERRLEVEMAEDASLTALEALVLGRAAMGETVATGGFSDQWRIRRAGRLVHAEALRASGDLAAATAGAATLGGARALATLVHLAPGAEARLDEVRRRLADTGTGAVTAAASAKPGLLVVRFLAPGAQALRAALIRFLMGFRAAALPRVWST
jgi:urease accessory protein